MRMTFKRLILILMPVLFFGMVMTAAQSTCQETSGITVRENYASAWLGQTMYYTVYLPPCYAQTAENYPVVYLMHGSNEDDGSWQRLGMIDALNADIQDGSLPEMILVLPFGNVIANRNRFDTMSWGNIFLTELLPDAEAKYRIDARRDSRVIGGISRGGFWAFQVGLRHPELFSAIAGHSPFFDEYHAEPQDNPLDLALNAPGVETFRLWLDRGNDDYAAPGVDLMHDRLTQRGLPHQYTVYPTGEHNNANWSQHVREYLDFYAAGWLTVPERALPTPTPAAAIEATAPILGFITNTPVGDAVPSISATPLPATAAPTTTPEASSGTGFLLYVPVVGFGSLQTTIELSRLQAIATGQFDDKLVVTPETLPVLPMLSTSIRTVPAAELESSLWRDRTLFALMPFDALTTKYRMLWVDDVPLVDMLDTYPFALKTGTSNFSPDKLTRLTLSGVTALTRTTRSMLDANGVEWAASGIQSYVQRSDFFHISNEVSMIPTCPEGSNLLGGSTAMCSKPPHFELLTRLDVDIVELTGNHNNDYGYQAYTDTLAWFRGNGMNTVGGGATLAEARNPLLLEHNGSTIGMIACNVPGPYYAQVNEDPNLLGGVRPGAAVCDKTWLEGELPALSAEVDVLIMDMQQLEIEDYLPTQEQRYQFRRMADLGADVVMGTAAHKPQVYEHYNASSGAPAFIHYGMGNLYFDQPFWGNMRFFMNTLYVYEGKLMTVEVFPGIIDDNARPRLMTSEERENFLYFMFVQHNGF